MPAHHIVRGARDRHVEYASRVIHMSACRVMCGRIEWPYRVGMVRNAALPKSLVDALVALAFLAVGWLSTAAPTISDPFYRYTPRDWLLRAAVDLGDGAVRVASSLADGSLPHQHGGHNGAVAARLQRGCAAARPHIRRLLCGGGPPRSGAGAVLCGGAWQLCAAVVGRRRAVRRSRCAHLGSCRRDHGGARPSRPTSGRPC
jgi:hypothetical protein